MQTAQITADRVRDNTADSINQKIDNEINASIQFYKQQDASVIRARIAELDKEWDIERTLEFNASAVAFIGVILSATVSKKWMILPGLVTFFLGQHAIQGWCPPLPLFRQMNIRTRKEIDKEKYALLELLKS
ncbi:MAG: hypothetical protein K0Q79_823 [Flavipsychrobacter sp.]|nr:hypothetical protein [Flavipsychrobacter sp.]